LLGARLLWPGAGADPLRVLFHAGFSTRGDSDMSAGRGMGLSAALEAVHRVGGDDVESVVGPDRRSD
jgi:chemotaxis protein histidine kinase CheA